MQPESKIDGSADQVLIFRARQLIGCFLLAVILLVAGCAAPIRHKTDPRWVGYTQSGKASYYAMKFQFRETASGERFNNFALCAAHKTLPFGTRVLVTNRANGKQVEVRINDRGPFVKGRIIDLTRAAFAKIARINKGVIDVELKVLP